MTPGIGCSAKPDEFDPCAPIPGSNGSATNQVGIILRFKWCRAPRRRLTSFPKNIRGVLGSGITFLAAVTINLLENSSCIRLFRYFRAACAHRKSVLGESRCAQLSG